MKRRLDLNEPGARLAGIAVLFIAGIPALLYSARFVVRHWAVGTQLLSTFTTLIRASVALGLLLAAVLFVLIVAEQVQDHLYHLHYRRNQHKKLRVSDTRYECPYCGNRRVGARNRHCAVCGRRLS